jgi:hypothetical protein
MQYRLSQGDCMTVPADVNLLLLAIAEKGRITREERRTSALFRASISSVAVVKADVFAF